LFRLCIWHHDWRERGDNASGQRNRSNLIPHPQKLLVAVIYSRRQPNRAVRELPPIRQECVRCCGVVARGIPPICVALRSRLEEPTGDQSSLLTHSMPPDRRKGKDQANFWSYPINFCFRRVPRNEETPEGEFAAEHFLSPKVFGAGRRPAISSFCVGISIGKDSGWHMTAYPFLIDRIRYERDRPSRSRTSLGE